MEGDKEVMDWKVDMIAKGITLKTDKSNYKWEVECGRIVINEIITKN